jgi:hypothetical protein
MLLVDETIEGLIGTIDLQRLQSEIGLKRNGLGEARLSQRCGILKSNQFAIWRMARPIWDELG